jgi:hypothetical protein
MTPSPRPLADRLEVRAPGLAAFVAQGLGACLSRSAAASFTRPSTAPGDAFNRGDL